MPAPPPTVPYQHSPGIGTMPGAGGGAPGAPGAPVGPPAPPDYLAQAQAQVHAQLDPILKYLTDKYGAQASAFSGLAGSVTNQYASWLGNAAGNVSSMFKEAQGPVSGAARAINAQMTQLGQQNAATEQAAMMQARQNSAQSPDINLAQEGKGAGGAAGAIGQAMINALQQEQAAAMKYAEGLPGFAQLQGQYETKQGLIQIAATLADQLAQTTAQAPQLLYQIYNDLLDRAQHDKEFAFQVRQYNDSLAAKRAGIVSATAPTVAGRTAYYQGLADRKTSMTGIEYVGTSTGIRPVDADPTRPGIQPSYTLQGRAAIRQGVQTQAQINQGQQKINETRRSHQQAEAAARERNRIAAQNAATATKRENDSHTARMRQLQIAEQNATTQQQRTAIQRQKAKEQHRHNSVMEGIAKKKAAGTTTAGGKKKAPLWNQPPKPTTG